MSEKVLKSKRASKGRSFQCTGYANCNKSFTRSEHLARHRRKHTGERPFTCSLCFKNFSRLDNLRQHKQTVHACEFHESTLKPPSAHSTRTAPQARMYIQRHHNTEFIPTKPFQSAEYQNANNSPTLASSNFSSNGGLQGKSQMTNKVSSSVITPPLTGSSSHHFSSGDILTRSSDTSLRKGTSRSSALASVTNITAPVFAESSSTDSLREPLKFKSKHRPMRLSLTKHNSDDSSVRRSNIPEVEIEPPLRTAPVVGSFSGAYFPEPRSAINEYHQSFRKSDYPQFPSLTKGSSYRSYFGYGPAVSPLSPLFHRSFNQVAHSSLSSFVKTPLHSTSSHLPSLPSVGKSRELPPVLPSLRLDNKMHTERTVVKKEASTDANIAMASKDLEEEDAQESPIMHEQTATTYPKGFDGDNGGHSAQETKNNAFNNEHEKINFESPANKSNIDFLVSGQQRNKPPANEDNRSVIQLENS